MNFLVNKKKKEVKIHVWDFGFFFGKKYFIHFKVIQEKLCDVKNYILIFDITVKNLRPKTKMSFFAPEIRQSKRSAKPLIFVECKYIKRWKTS